MNNMCKNKIFNILNIIVKTGTLIFYCRYLSIKNLVVCASDTTKWEKKLQTWVQTWAQQTWTPNLSTEARLRICNCYDIHVATTCDN